MLYGMAYHQKKEDKNIKINVNKTISELVIITIEDNGIGRKTSAKIKAQKIINRKSTAIILTK